MCNYLTALETARAQKAEQAIDPDSLHIPAPNEPMPPVIVWRRMPAGEIIPYIDDKIVGYYDLAELLKDCRGE